MIFKKTFELRILIILFVLTLFMFCGIVRVVSISTNDLLVLSSKNTVTIELSSRRGNIFDCNKKRITSSKGSYKAVFLPTEAAIIKFASLTSGKEREQGLQKLKNNKPTAITVNEPIKANGVYNVSVYNRYDNLYGLEHFIGYLDAENNGVTGLERIYNDLLYSSEQNTASFSITAGGKYLVGDEPVLDQKEINNGIALTIDMNIQKIVFSATQNLKKGVVVVSSVKDGKIRGIINKPSYNSYKIDEYINNEDAPLFNRAIYCYSVGSVFKPLIAAALLEENKEDFENNCIGYSDFLNKRFYCNKRNGHGLLGLREGLIFSCNTYFYNSSLLIEPENYLNLATSLGFTNKIQLCKDMYVAAGQVTDVNVLKSSNAAMANFSIGQGNISLSPITILNLYSAIANGGYYYSPTLIEGEYKDGKIISEEKTNKTPVFSIKTAKHLNEYLTSVISEGTGKKANPENVLAAGKTATAQTGQIKNGTELLNGWFCGYFPADNPKYAISVFCEDSTSGGDDCGPIFKEIAEQITEFSY